MRSGDVVELLERLNKSVGVAGLFSHQETGNGWTYARDLRVLNWCQHNRVPWHEDRQDGVIRRLKSREGWASRWDKFMGEPLTAAPNALEPLNAISIGGVPEPSELGLAPDGCTTRQPGGRKAGLSLLHSFLHERGESYQRAMSSPISAVSTCSRLSPHLAYGTLSVREVAQATWARQRELKAVSPQVAGSWRRALSSFSGRLHWRCHFMQKLEDEPPIEFRSMHPAYEGLRDSVTRESTFCGLGRGQNGGTVFGCMYAISYCYWLDQFPDAGDDDGGRKLPFMAQLAANRGAYGKAIHRL